MRMRRKPYAREELKACPFDIDEPLAYKGIWRTAFQNPENPLYVELGMGKGGFISKLAHQHKDINFLGIDIKSEVIVVAKRNIESVYGQDAIDNIKIMSWDIERLFMMMSEEDNIDRIYINFCNPWPKHGDKKHRLTYPRQLKMYAKFLKPGAQLRFKTDDDGLYKDTERYLIEEGWKIIFNSRDFERTPMPENIVTEHEKMYMEEGKKIKGMIALPPEKIQNATNSCANEKQNV